MAAVKKFERIVDHRYPGLGVEEDCTALPRVLKDLFDFIRMRHFISHSAVISGHRTLKGVLGYPCQAAADVSFGFIMHVKFDPSPKDEKI